MRSQTAICPSGLSWRCANAMVSFSFRNKPAQSKPGSGDRIMSWQGTFVWGHTWGHPQEARVTFPFSTMGPTDQLAGRQLSRHDLGVSPPAGRRLACWIGWDGCVGVGVQCDNTAVKACAVECKAHWGHLRAVKLRASFQISAPKVTTGNRPYLVGLFQWF